MSSAYIRVNGHASLVYPVRANHTWTVIELSLRSRGWAVVSYHCGPKAAEAVVRRERPRTNHVFLAKEIFRVVPNKPRPPAPDDETPRKKIRMRKP